MLLVLYIFSLPVPVPRITTLIMGLLLKLFDKGLCLTWVMSCLVIFIHVLLQYYDMNPRCIKKVRP